MTSINFNKKVIFVGGIHGVGKTTLCRVISENLKLKHYSASELISNLKSENIAKVKNVTNIMENQNILLESVNRYLSDEEYYLLDGHFCLLNSDGAVTEVPLDTFKSLGIKAIVILVDEEFKILKRLVDRDSKKYSIDLIREFQQREISYAQEVSKCVGVKYKIFNASSDADEMLILISSILNE